MPHNLCSHVAGRETEKVPSLWSFVLAIAGTVIILSLILIIIYRLVLRKRRTEFQRRINEGEVDIEALALNQMKAPREIVEKMPLYTYLEIKPSQEATPLEEKVSANPTENEYGDKTNVSLANEDHHFLDDAGLTKPQAAVVKPGPNDPCRSLYRLSHTQTTCAICIDDFVPGSSVVRELPCGHIFDSECIDPFLTQNSCLCPLCKKSVLPPGSFYISVTNEMVQRGHLSRRFQ